MIEVIISRVRDKVASELYQEGSKVAQLAGDLLIHGEPIRMGKPVSRPTARSRQTKRGHAKLLAAQRLLAAAESLPIEFRKSSALNQDNDFHRAGLEKEIEEAITTLRRQARSWLDDLGLDPEGIERRRVDAALRRRNAVLRRQLGRNRSP